MLVLKRSRGQSIIIGADIRVTFVGFENRKVKLGVSAPGKPYDGAEYVLDRRQELILDYHHDIRLAVLRTIHGQLQLGIHAPDLNIVRGELTRSPALSSLPGKTPAKPVRWWQKLFRAFGA